MKKIIFFCKALMMGLCISFLLYHNSQAQLEGKNWVFGANNRISFEDSGAKHTHSLGLEMEYGSALSDKDGKLLFYTTIDTWNTVSMSIRDSTGKVLPDGMDIDGNYINPNESLFLPFDEDSGSFLLLHVGYENLLYKTIIKKVEGTYSVVQKNILIEGTPNGVAYKFCAIRHGNGKDWWVIIRGNDGDPATFINSFFVFLVTQNEVVLHNKLKLKIEDDGGKFGEFFASLSGDIVVSITAGMYEERNWINFFRFDRSNGTIKDFKKITQKMIFNRHGVYSYWQGVSISPSGRNIFVSNGEVLCQTNIHTLNLKPIYKFRLADFTKNNLQLSQHELGLDGKIYISHPETELRDKTNIYPTKQSQYLGVIDNTDSNNPTYDHFGFYLNGNNCNGKLPNMPNYRLGPLLFSEVAKAGQFSDKLYVCLSDSVKLGTFQRDHIKYKWITTAAGLAGIKSDTLASPWFNPDGNLSKPGDSIMFILHTEALPSSFWPGEKATDTVWVIIGTKKGDVCDSGVGIEFHQTAKKDQIKIAPNPATDHITIQLPGEMTGGTKMEIFDMQGRMILKQEISGHTDLDTGSFPDGIYLFRFQTENKPIITQKLIIQR